MVFFPALADIPKRKGGMLSGGQQQQLAICTHVGNGSKNVDIGRTCRRYPT